MDDVMGLIDRAHHGDERARAQLVEQNTTAASRSALILSNEA